MVSCKVCGARGRCSKRRRAQIGRLCEDCFAALNRQRCAAAYRHRKGLVTDHEAIWIPGEDWLHAEWRRLRHIEREWGGPRGYVPVQ